MLPSLGALKSVGSGLYNMGRGALFLGASKGASGAGKAMNAVGHALPLAPAVAGSFKATSNQPGFQPQSTVKTSVSREWINQRVQNAVDSGASPERLQGFTARNDARAQQLNDRLLTTIQQGGAVDPRQAGSAGKRLTAYTAGTFATAPAGRYQYETPGMSASFNGNGYSYPSSQHALHVPEKLNTTPKVPPQNPAGNNLRRYWPLALGGALAAGAYGLYRHNRNSPSEQEAEPKQAEGKAMNAVGHALPLAPAVAGSFKATSNQPGFPPQSTIKTADGDSRGEPSLLRDVAEGAGYGALAGTPVGMLTGRHYADRSANDMVDFIMKGLTGTQPSHFDGVKPKHTVNATLAPVLGGAVVGGAIGGARHMYNRKKEANHPVVERALRAKVASSDWHRPVNALSYAAFAAPYLSQTVHDNHKLTAALNAAGLLGLGATSADSLAKGDGLAGYDLAGLGLMGAGLVHGALRPSPTPGAGH